ncbi:MAG: DNA polymerase Y family protein [Pseudomonadota bacterium]|nr:DNA polymerase Y family protein [Pseudomonadota bacterium]
MSRRRILCLWLPLLAAERELRRPGLAHHGLTAEEEGEEGGEGRPPFAVAEDLASGLRLVSVNRAAAAAGLSPGMALTDARAMIPGLATRMRDRGAETRFRAGLLRWAQRFSPWAAAEAVEDTPERGGEGGLALDITGCAHLFGGEAEMAARMVRELADLGLSARAGIADSRGGAWALARFGGEAPGPSREAAGDAIRQDAHATRVRSPSRATERRGGWAGTWGRARRGGDAEAGGARPPVAIAPPGGSRVALAPLPVACLRLPPATVAALMRLGLRAVGDLYGMPRAALARRFGAELPARLDQALGAAPEPVSPAPPPRLHAARLTLPEPIGLRADLEAALARLLVRLCARREEEGLGARRLRLAIRRVDGGEQAREVGLARAGRDPARLAGLFDRALGEFDAGFGVDAVRLEAVLVEPLSDLRPRGHFEARAEAQARAAPGGGADFADLLGRLGARIGLERLMRLQPGDSHLPEKCAHLAAAAWSSPPASGWRAAAPPGTRPLTLFDPEPIRLTVPGRPPQAFVWRRGERRVQVATGPERIAPEWWLDDPAWRSGPRDYWRVETETGERLWIFEARGGDGPDRSNGWFLHGVFA